MHPATKDRLPPDFPRHRLKFRRLAGSFAVCRLPAGAAVPHWGLKGHFTSITRTADELSVVCPRQNVPDELQPEVSWTCFQIEGPFSFTQVGILASFLDPLARRGISVFAISTYDTDYVLVNEEFAATALDALKAVGHQLICD